MSPISEQHRRMLYSISRQYPDLREFVSAWRQDELERLAVTSESNFGMLKGRVQLLTELQQHLSPTNP